MGVGSRFKRTVFDRAIFDLKIGLAEPVAEPVAESHKRFWQQYGL